MCIHRCNKFGFSSSLSLSKLRGGSICGWQRDWDGGGAVSEVDRLIRGRREGVGFGGIGGLMMALARLVPLKLFCKDPDQNIFVKGLCQNHNFQTSIDVINISLPFGRGPDQHKVCWCFDDQCNSLPFGKGPHQYLFMVWPKSWLSNSKKSIED